jgi:hypothetical protein
MKTGSAIPCADFRRLSRTALFLSYPQIFRIFHHTKNTCKKQGKMLGTFPKI